MQGGDAGRAVCIVVVHHFCRGARVVVVVGRQVDVVGIDDESGDECEGNDDDEGVGEDGEDDGEDDDEDDDEGGFCDSQKTQSSSPSRCLDGQQQQQQQQEASHAPTAARPSFLTGKPVISLHLHGHLLLPTATPLSFLRLLACLSPPQPLPSASCHPGKPPVNTKPPRPTPTAPTAAQISIAPVLLISFLSQCRSLRPVRNGSIFPLAFVISTKVLTAISVSRNCNPSPIPPHFREQCTPRQQRPRVWCVQCSMLRLAPAGSCNELLFSHFNTTCPWEWRGAKVKKMQLAATITVRRRACWVRLVLVLPCILSKFSYGALQLKLALRTCQNRLVAPMSESISPETIAPFPLLVESLSLSLGTSPAYRTKARIDFSVAKKGKNMVSTRVLWIQPSQLGRFRRDPSLSHVMQLASRSQVQPLCVVMAHRGPAHARA
ncbi:hypothetical protein NLG97_g1559 [Lecanicillium saksenae]|uniref:Uncharacterized protein n=1 Tax=Lecanicillium saksenae TaxID=468837 RepID=A0ACC1R5B7_9HYPO|nr:hypothetical protein NLG97_g1559 [Lecanicillium saksenae]